MRTLLFTALLAISTASVAQPYVFLGLGPAWAKAAGTSQDGSALELGAGYKFGKFIGVEASYHDSDGRSDDSVAGNFSTLRFWKSSGFGASAVGFLPLSPSFSLLAKVGAHRLESDTRRLITELQPVSVTREDVTMTSTKWAPSLAIGAQYSFTDEVHLRAAFRQFNPGGDLDRIRTFLVEIVRSF